MSIDNIFWIYSVAYLVVELLAIGSCVHVIMKGRNTQGVIAWTLSLLFFPWLALPLYWIFGSHRFHGHVAARRSGNLEIHHIARDLHQRAAAQSVLADIDHPDLRSFSKLAQMPFSTGNQADLLVDGKATFDAIFAGIEEAHDYLLVQFFTIKDDAVGHRLRECLAARARAGVRVYFLYDGIGSRKLPARYLETLRRSGVEVSGFKATKGRAHRFQLNFRNHRKIVIADGRVAYVGGHNVGREYLGESRKFGHWRDTHVAVRGPSVQAIQLSFLEDWYWATGRVPTLDWTPRPLPEAANDILVVPTGPSDELDTCGLFFVHAINTARNRLWITSPYFVPDEAVESALICAALRDVDVRILLPSKPDHILVYLSAFSYFESAIRAGVKFYRYQPGFLHQKVMLIDDRLASVGTANLDNRSFRINFELTLLFSHPRFVREVEAMLIKDFESARPVGVDEYRRRPVWFRLAVRIARLFSPIQ